MRHLRPANVLFTSSYYVVAAVGKYDPPSDVGPESLNDRSLDTSTEFTAFLKRIIPRPLLLILITEPKFHCFIVIVRHERRIELI